jgi:multidrug resistance efflux pump
MPNADGERTLSLSDRVRSLKLPDREKHRPLRAAWLPWTLCVLLAGTTAFFALQAYFFSPPASSQETDSAGSSGRSREEEASADTSGQSGPIALESKGYIIPVQQILVSPKVSGMIMELNVIEGARVKEGDVLAKLETTEFQAEYDRTLAAARAAEHRMLELTKYRDSEIKQAKAEFDDTKAQAEHAFREWKRKADLRSSLASSASEYELANSNYRSMTARLERLQLAYDLLVKGPRDEKIQAARAEHEQAQAELAKAKWKLDNCTVRAPASGTILIKRAEKGNMVNPSAFSNGLSASLCEMADLTNMEVELSIAERDIHKIYRGQKCIVRAEAFENRPYRGIVSRIMPMADRSKGAVPVRVKIDIPPAEEGQYLRPEMGAIVTFYNEKESETLSGKAEIRQPTSETNSKHQ